MSILKTVAASKAARLGVALSLTGAALVGFAGQPAQAAVAKGVVSPSTGPTTVGTVVAVTGAGYTTAAGAALADSVTFQLTACVEAAGGTPATLPAVISATRIVATAPVLALTDSKPTKFNVCVHDTTPTPDVLLAAATYTAYAPPTITAANSPASGPAAGGNSVILTGTAFTAKSVVKFGSFTSPKVTVAKDGLSLVAVAPAQAAGAVAVSVTTEGGTNATPGTASFDADTYTNALTVTPKLGGNATPTPITITGVGFKALNFAAGGTNATVFFVPGAYVKATHGIGGSAPAAECTNIQVLSDTELVCTTPSSISDTPHIVTVVANKAFGAATPGESVVSSSAAFTFAAF
jgi:hypothetical protein